MIDYLRTEACARTASGVGRWSSAAQLWATLVERNPVDGRNWFELARARFATGDHAGALPAYERALELGVWRPDDVIYRFDLAYRIACCHARLGDVDPAVAALSRAMDLGLRDIDAVWTEPSLAPLRSDPWFVRTFRPPDVDGVPRDEGWRFDLRLFAREVRRRAHRAPAESFDGGVAALDEAIPRLTDAQIVVELTRLLRPLGDGHAYVGLPERHDLRAALPLLFFHFEEGVHVIAAAPEYRHLLGAQVLRVDDLPVSDVLAALDPLITRDNEQWPRYDAARWLRRVPFLHALGVAHSSSSVTLTLDGHDAPVTVAADSTTSSHVGEWPPPPGWAFYPSSLDPPLPHYLRNLGALYWFEQLPGSIYLQFNGVGDDPVEPLADFCRRLFSLIDAARVDRLVIDLRWNSGGNTFLAQPLVHHVIGCPAVNRPGGLFVIIGRKTFSAAQNTAVLLERHTHATFVGEPTGSSPNFVGETIPFVLPHSTLEVNVSDLYWQTSWPMDHRTWIAPTLYAPPTFAAFAANTDPAMDAIHACDEHLPGW